LNTLVRRPQSTCLRGKANTECCRTVRCNCQRCTANSCLHRFRCDSFQAHSPCIPNRRLYSDSCRGRSSRRYCCLDRAGRSRVRSRGKCLHLPSTDKHRLHNLCSSAGQLRLGNHPERIADTWFGRVDLGMYRARSRDKCSRPARLDRCLRHSSHSCSDPGDPGTCPRCMHCKCLRR
jgi:hypothetical protein